MPPSPTSLAVIPTLRGRPDELRELSETLAAIGLPPVLVVNGRSLHEALDERGTPHVDTQDNAGFGASVRAGLATAPAWDWVAIVNDDVVIDEVTVKPQVLSVLHRDPTLPYLGYLDPGPLMPIPTTLSVFTSVSMLAALGRKIRRREPDLAPGKGYKSFSFVIISRGLWDALGGLDTRLIHTYEDSDFAARAHAAGADVEFLDSTGVTHVGSSTGKKHVDRVLPVGVFSAAQYLRTLGVSAFTSKGVIVAALLVRLLFVPFGDADRRSHVRGIRDAIKAVLWGRRPSLPPYDES